MKHVIKTKESLIIFMILLIMVSLSIIVLQGNITPDVASATTSPSQSVEEVCAEYTDSDIIPETGLTIREYPTELALGTVSFDHEAVVHEDDPIVNIIPRQYFVERGEHFYIGKEYGFFVSTKEMYTNSASNLIIAFVFDISSMHDMEQTQNRVIVKVQPLFQYYYAYLTQTDDYYIIPQTGAYVYWDRISQNGNVIPLVLSETEALPSTEFYLKDVSFSITLYNEQELNTINKRYRPKDDDGSFIIQYDYYYDGINRTSQGFDVTPHDAVAYVTTGVDIICGIIGPLFPAAKIVSLVGRLSSLANASNVFSDIVEEANQTGPVDVDVSNGAITATCLYTTKRDQLNHYVDVQKQKPALTKSATIFVRGDDRKGNIWYKAGNSAEGYFTLSDSEDTTPWYTRYIQEIALSVVDKDGNEHVSKALDSREYMLYDPIYKPGYVGSNVLAFLPHGKQYVSFRPQFTGDYEIAFDKPYEFNVVVVDTRTNKRTTVTPVEGKYKYRFIGGRTYKVEMYSPYGDVINTTFEPVDNTVSQAFDEKGKNVFKYVSTENQIVTLSSSSSDVLIEGIYQKDESGELIQMPNTGYFNACVEVEAYMQEGQTYYIVLKNNVPTTAYASVAIAKTDKVLNTASINLEGGANFKYYRFTPSENGDYIVLFENNLENFGENDAIEYRCFDQSNGDIVYTHYRSGYVILSNLIANADYYVGIRSTRAMTVTPTINRSTDAFVWKMKVNGEYEPVENILHLKRGQTYEFALWINGVKARDYDVDNLYGDYYVEDTTGLYCKVQIKNNAIDNTGINIYALCEEGSRQRWDYNLTVYAEYDVSKVDFDINYNNTTAIAIKDQHGAKHINGFEISLYINGNVETKTVNATSINIYSELVAKKAYLNTYFVLKSITIESASGDGHRQITDLNRKFDIGTVYSTTSVENGKTVYHIANGLQFYNIRHNQNNKRVLDNDISLAEFKDKWTPIPSLRCDIDGNHHSITNLKLILDAPYSINQYGLVAVNNATISNLTLADFNMSYGWEEKPNWMYVGAFAGVNNGTINNCIAYGSIYGYREYMSVGGITGQNNGNIIGTTYGRPVGNLASVVYSWGELGGIAGQNYGLIQHTRVLNTKMQHRVYGSSRSIGGIAGYASNCEIANCAVEDSIIENINDQVIKSFTPKMGIIFGHMVNGTITSVGARNVQTSTGKLDNTMYCFKGGWGFLGLMENCIVDGNVGQYAP